MKIETFDICGFEDFIKTNPILASASFDDLDIKNTVISSSINDTYRESAFIFESISINSLSTRDLKYLHDIRNMFSAYL